MHIKFLRHGQGSASGAVRYLLGSHDHRGVPRAEVSVLRGDPSMVANVADSSRHQWRYTSGVIAWAPGDRPTPAQIEQVIGEWEAAAFAGLDPDQYASCAVLHRDDDGTAHVHTLTARVELTTGRALNIAPPGHERLFDPLRDAWNHARGWARPDDPDRARRVEPGRESHRDRADHHPMRRADINAYIEDMVIRGRVTNADEVRAALADIGEITRTGASYVSVRPEGAKRAIRLRGDLFRADWHIDQTIERERHTAQDALAGNAGRVNPEAAHRAQERLASAMERRRLYHQKRYPITASRRPERTDAPPGIESLPTDPYRDIGSPTEDIWHDRTGDPAAASVGAAADRIRAAGERAVETAGALADSAEHAAARQRRPETGNASPAGRIRAARERIVGTATALADSAERSTERERHATPGGADSARSDAAGDRYATAGGTRQSAENHAGIRALDAEIQRNVAALAEFAESVEKVTTAYGAWMARKAERERQVHELSQRPAPAADEPAPTETASSFPDAALDRARTMAQRMLMMANDGEREAVIRDAAADPDLEFFDELVEQMLLLGIDSLGDLTPDGEKRRAELLDAPPQEPTQHQKRLGPDIDSMPGPDGPSM